MLTTLSGKLPVEVYWWCHLDRLEIVERQDEVVNKFCWHLDEKITVWSIQLFSHNRVDSRGLHIHLIEDDLTEMETLKFNLNSQAYFNGVCSSWENSSFDLEV